jgi:DNA-binding MarR family transcriptional regulator
MADSFTSHGKQVLMNGTHFADATDPDDAALIAERCAKPSAPIDYGKVASTLAALVTAGDTMTLRQLALLGTVSSKPGPHRVRFLASELNVSKPVITRALTSLAERGLINRIRDEIDKRDVVIRATNLGELVFAGISKGMGNG